MEINKSVIDRIAMKLIGNVLVIRSLQIDHGRDMSDEKKCADTAYLSHIIGIYEMAEEMIEATKATGMLEESYKE